MTAFQWFMCLYQLRLCWEYVIAVLVKAQQYILLRKALSLLQQEERILLSCTEFTDIISACRVSSETLLHICW
eukprot:m.253130 g.253130  ORF g.253130 m.253130 type:complete len:73 (+) comp40366_c0_seq21:503-721(+)